MKVEQYLQLHTPQTHRHGSQYNEQLKLDDVTWMRGNAI